MRTASKTATCLVPKVHNFFFKCTTAVGEPPLVLASSVFHATKDAIYAARSDHGLDDFFILDSPATTERIRMLCADPIVQRVTNGNTAFRAKASV